MGSEIDLPDGVTGSMVEGQFEGTRWEAVVDGSITVWDFKEGMSMETFWDEPYPTYRELCRIEDWDGLVTEIHLEEPFGDEALEVWDQAGDFSAEQGVSRWAVVSEGLVGLAVKSRLKADGLEVMTTEDRDEAISWAKGSQ